MNRPLPRPPAPPALERQASKLWKELNLHYMIIERFKPGGAAAIYRRAAEKGRMLPAGVHYIDSWVSADLEVCYQIMETDEVALIAQWTRQWDDLIDFEITPIIPSDEACARALAGV